MADIDKGLIGGVIAALPMDKMISSPLMAMIQAQVAASRAYADFLLNVCIKDGKAVAIEFDYNETIVDENGQFKGTLEKQMRVPLLAAISHPNITIEEGSIEFELTISQMAEESSSTEAEGSFEAKMGWGPFSVSVRGSASHKSTQTRKTDTRARYAISTKIVRQDPPEALMRVIDFLTDAATKPVVLPSSKINAEGANDDVYNVPAKQPTP